MKLGKAFVDSVTMAKKHTFLHMPHIRGWGARLTLLYILLIVAFFVLLTRLFHLAIVMGDENRSLSEENRIREVTIHAPRGILYDRRGQPLVKNITAYRNTHLCDDQVLCQPHNTLTTESNPTPAGSIYLERDYIREYVYPAETAHVLGYLGEVSLEELAYPSYLYRDYLLGDRIGRLGLESVFESELRGKDGKELIEVDSQDNRLRTLGKIDAVPGQDLELTLDIVLQRVAFAGLGENPGAVVVSKPKTGEVLVLVSTPSFSPNQIHTGLTDREFTALFEASDRPLFNRAISGAYPPGSTFKIITAAAGLESGQVTKETRIEDTGILTIGSFSFSNWYFSQYGKTEGQVDIVKAIARSNDIYFYKLGEMVGVEKLATWGNRFGIGQKSGVELPGEAEGVMPDPEWRKKVKGEDWYLGDTYHLAIGQGELATTPLQVNLWTNAIASGGVWCRPTLLKASREVSRSEIGLRRTGSGSTRRNCQDLEISKETNQIIIEGMSRACAKDGGWGYQGTGWPLFDFTVLKENLGEAHGVGQRFQVPIACKTGTAEFGDPKNRTHAWFTAFAPIPADFITGMRQMPETQDKLITGEPEIAVTVLVEAGGEGSSVAAPIAKKILEEWFKR